MSLLWFVAGATSIGMLGALALLVLVTFPVRVVAGIFPYRVTLEEGLPLLLHRWIGRLAPWAFLSCLLWLMLAYSAYGARLAP